MELVKHLKPSMSKTHCASFAFSVALWIGKSEMAVLAKIESGGTSGFNLDLHCIGQFGSEVMMCPAAQLAYLHLVDLFPACSDRIQISCTYCK